MKVLPCDLFGQVILRPRWRYTIIYIYICVCIHTLRQEVVHVRKFLSMALRLSSCVWKNGFHLLLQIVFQGHWIATAAVSAGLLFNADLVFSIYLLFTVVICSLRFKSSSRWFWRFWPPPVLAFVSSSNKRGRNIIQPRSQPGGSFMKMFYCSHADGCTLAEISSRQKYIFVFPSQKKDIREKPATKNNQQQPRCLCQCMSITKSMQGCGGSSKMWRNATLFGCTVEEDVQINMKVCFHDISVKFLGWGWLAA